MHWLLFALANPFAHAIVNHLDKYILSKWMGNFKAGVLVIFSSLIAALALPVLLLLDSSLLNEVSLLDSLILTVNGSLLAGATLLYLMALDKDEVSNVVPFFEIIPILSAVLGFFILGEVLSMNQLWAAALIVLGGLLLTFESSAEGTVRIKTRLLALMMASSVFYAVNAVVFKLFTLSQSFSAGLFWNMSGVLLFGVATLLANRNYRKDFFMLMRTHSYKIIGLNVLNEIVVLIGDVSLMYAILLAPVALVMTIGGLQPLFVFSMGVVITIFFPRFGKESLVFKHIVQKLVAAIIIMTGVIILY